VGALLFSALAVPGVAGPATDGTAVALPDWLEPRAQSVVDLVSQIEERALRGAIVSFDDGEGLVIYESGSRVGSTVTVTTTLFPRVTYPAWLAPQPLTAFGCLGQYPRYDHMGSVAPASHLRLYAADGTEVTHEVDYMYISAMGTRLPQYNSSMYLRYTEIAYGPGKTFPMPPVEPNGLAIPSNSGCRLEIPGRDYVTLTGVFTLEISEAVHASILGTQTGTFRSYVGVGDVGIVQPLMDQMRAAYPDRHERIALEIPAGTNYFLLRYPAMPVDPYTDRSSLAGFPNADRPSSGSYRLEDSDWRLSADMTISGVFPLKAVWRDADQAPQASYLPVVGPVTRLAVPEYVVPAGVQYHPCFTQGSCSAAILETIYKQVMSLEIVYLSVAPADGAVYATELRLAGPIWTTGQRSAPIILEAAEPELHAIRVDLDQLVYVPVVFNMTPPCRTYPCGWFDSLGRMLGYLAAQ